MCARLLSCPLCAHPGFLTLDALCAGLLSVATRQLVCPVCNEVLLGIDKLTIHLCGHTIINDNKQEPTKFQTSVGQNALHNAHLHKWDSRSTSVGDAVVEQKIGESYVSPVPVNANINEKIDEAAINSSKVNQVILMRTQSEPIPLVDPKTHDLPVPSAFVLKKIEETNSIRLEKNVAESVSVENSSSSFCDPSDESKKQTIDQAAWIESLVKDSTNDHAVTPMEQSIGPSVDSNNFSKGSSSDDSEGILSSLKALQNLATREKTERCNICGYNCPDRNILILHKKLVHLVDTKDSNTPAKDLLKNFPCRLCSKVFKHRGSFMIHMRVVHAGFDQGSTSKDGEVFFTVNENGYNCPTCGKSFQKEQHVTQHLKTHEGKQWECDVCSKMFTTKYFLKKHKRLHSGEMPYKCNICDKTFTFQQSYHKHRLYHKDDKPHTCGTCGRSFKELSTLHNHERIHTGEKPFPCETCGKCFRQRVSYLVHRRIHTGVMPYKCATCGKSFRYKVSQRTHKCHGTECQPPESSDQATAEASNVEKSMVEVNNQQQSTAVNVSSENKFVLIIDDQGQHVLARHSESRPAEGNEKTWHQPNNDNIWKQLWDNQNLTNESSQNNNQNLQLLPEETKSNEPSHQETTNDLFSMVMSPIEHDLPSPTNQMEHLRLSSPRSQEPVTTQENPNLPDTNFQRGDIDNTALHEDSPCQTINEEYLKALIYNVQSSTRFDRK